MSAIDTGVSAESKGRFSLRRTLLIARRDYLGYIKTWGFWISFFLPFIFGGLGFLYASLDINIDPIRYEAILDDTGQHSAGIIARDNRNYNRKAGALIEKLSETVLSESDSDKVKSEIKSGGADGAMAYLKSNHPSLADQVKLPPRKTMFVDPPAPTIDALQPYLRGEKKIMVDGETATLSGVLHIRQDNSQNDSVEPAKVVADYWSKQINALTVKSLARGYFRDKAEADYLSAAGLKKSDLVEVRADALPLQSFDPTKATTADGAGQKVTRLDQVPYFVAAGLAFILWLTVFSGSYMLLTSMLEEKLNKLLEMMLATTRFSEIIFGKLIGVAALTITAMLPYLLLGIGGVIAVIVFGTSEQADAIRGAFSAKMFVFFFIYLILGYVFYGAFFIALGALAESMQDAQTLTTPIMIVLTVCILIVPKGIENPESPIVTFAAWFPLSAPFAAIMRLPLDPPWWELALSAAFLGVLSIGVIILAGRIFRYGVLSGSGVKGISGWFKRTVLRRPA